MVDGDVDAVTALILVNVSRACVLPEFISALVALI